MGKGADKLPSDRSGVDKEGNPSGNLMEEIEQDDPPMISITPIKINRLRWLVRICILTPQ
ncbi:MAG: hypothetical protein A2Y54_04885 [Chloroflexi bacterium RBG_16_51_16]|nr:MAG: hypothetical protein A2Y54_04885 [Chloroflexi bacterium RBG_16_51_16]